MRRNKNQIEWQIMVLPAMVFLLIFNILPLFGLVTAFQDFKLSLGFFNSPWAKVNGETDVFKHFKFFFSDPAVWGVIRNTLVMNILGLAINFPLPIVFALLLNEIFSTNLKKGIQTITYLPHFFSWIVFGSMFVKILNPTTGITVAIAELFNKETIDFINEPEIEDVRMFIVSTAAVEAKWRYPYAGSVSGPFCSESGKTTKVKMMTSVEKCFTLPGAKGIKKEYEGNLCFAAILPDGGLDSFVESLDAEKLKDALKTSSGDITAIIPKFKKESKADLTEVLKEAGFSLDGDFSRIAPDSGETFVSKAISAVSIENDEFGTKAFAASEITVKESAAMETITFNRPFLYLVYDTETLMPLFIGAVKEI